MPPSVSTYHTIHEDTCSLVDRVTDMVYHSRTDEVVGLEVTLRCRRGNDGVYRRASCGGHYANTIHRPARSEPSIVVRVLQRHGYPNRVSHRPRCEGCYGGALVPRGQQPRHPHGDILRRVVTHVPPSVVTYHTIQEGTCSLVDRVGDMGFTPHPRSNRDMEVSFECPRGIIGHLSEDLLQRAVDQQVPSVAAYHTIHRDMWFWSTRVPEVLTTREPMESSVWR